MILYWTGLVLCAIGLAVLLNIIESKTKLKWILWVVILIGITFYGLGSEAKKEKEIYGALAEEVSPEQITLQGQRKFSAQIRIVYKNGKLESVKLVPKTTYPYYPYP